MRRAYSVSLRLRHSARSSLSQLLPVARDVLRPLTGQHRRYFESFRPDTVVPRARSSQQLASRDNPAVLLRFVQRPGTRFHRISLLQHTLDPAGPIRRVRCSSPSDPTVSMAGSSPKIADPASPATDRSSAPPPGLEPGACRQSRADPRSLRLARPRDQCVGLVDAHDRLFATGTAAGHRLQNVLHAGYELVLASPDPVEAPAPASSLLSTEAAILVFNAGRSPSSDRSWYPISSSRPKASTVPPLSPPAGAAPALAPRRDRGAGQTHQPQRASNSAVEEFFPRRPHQRRLRPRGHSNPCDLHKPPFQVLDRASHAAAVGVDQIAYDPGRRSPGLFRPAVAQFLTTAERVQET